MEVGIEPVQVPSLREACAARLEHLILSGELEIGQRLPPERELAARLGVSRPVLHEALLELTNKGLVEISPRRGVYILDYRRSGSMALLTSLMAFNNGQLDPQFMRSLAELRLGLEVSAARLAALRRTPLHLIELRSVLNRENQANPAEPAALVDLDFSFHLMITVASGNLVFPMVLNSFKQVYTTLTGIFFAKACGTPVVNELHQVHAMIVSAIERQQPDEAAALMEGMLREGEKYLY